MNDRWPEYGIRSGWSSWPNFRANTPLVENVDVGMLGLWTLLTAPAASPRPCELFKVAINRQSHDGQSRSLNVSELSSELEFSFRNSKARILHVSEWHPLGNFVCARGNERARLAKNICVTDSLELKYSEPSLLISISFYFNQFINNFYRFINT